MGGFMRKAIFLYIILLFSLVTGNLCQAGGSFCLQDLGTLGGSNSLANMLNDTGQIVGWSHHTAGNAEPHAFLWKSAGGMQDLGTLGGTESFAYGINETGQIIGGSDTSDDLSYRAVLWEIEMQDINMQPLDIFENGTNSEAFGINDIGQIVGRSDTADNVTSHAVLWENNSKHTIHDLGTLGGSQSEALWINESGQIIGWSDTKPSPGNSKPHAFLWEEINKMQDLGTLEGGSNSAAVWINDSGQIVGSSDSTEGTTHAVLWENDSKHTIHDLGTLGGSESAAYAINESGQIVGGSYIEGDVEWHAFLWQDGVMHDLGTLGGSDSDGFAINNKGQIIGVSDIAGDVEFHAFLASKCASLTWLMLLLD
jgi:probable HAF family extracellular repeat protein